MMKSQNSITHDPLQLCTVAEVAQLFCIKPKTVYSWVAQRKIRHIKLNGALRFLRQDLEALLRPVEAPAQRLQEGGPLDASLPAPELLETLAKVRRRIG